MSGYLHFYAQHPAIALIAEKLNESGNAFHNTADWQDETDYLGGKSACDIVQEALNAADEAFNTLAAAEGGGDLASCPRIPQCERDCLDFRDGDPSSPCGRCRRLFHIAESAVLSAIGGET